MILVGQLLDVARDRRQQAANPARLLRHAILGLRGGREQQQYRDDTDPPHVAKSSREARSARPFTARVERGRPLRAKRAITERQRREALAASATTGRPLCAQRRGLYRPSGA